MILTEGSRRQRPQRCLAHDATKARSSHDDRVVAALLNMGTAAPPSAVIHRAYHSDTAPVNSPSCEPARERMRRGYFFAFAGYFAASCAAAMA